MPTDKIKELEEIIEDLKEELEESKSSNVDLSDEITVMEHDHKNYDDAIGEHEEIAEKAFNAGYVKGFNNPTIKSEVYKSENIRAWLNYKIEARL